MTIKNKETKFNFIQLHSFSKKVASLEYFKVFLKEKAKP